MIIKLKVKIIKLRTNIEIIELYNIKRFYNFIYSTFKFHVSPKFDTRTDVIEFVISNWNQTNSFKQPKFSLSIWFGLIKSLSWLRAVSTLIS